MNNICQYCSSTFSTKSNLTRHEKTCKTPTHRICDCGKKYKSEKRLTSHKLKCIYIKCQFCSNSSTKRELESHLENCSEKLKQDIQSLMTIHIKHASELDAKLQKLQEDISILQNENTTLKEANIKFRERSLVYEKSHTALVALANKPTTNNFSLINKIVSVENLSMYAGNLNKSHVQSASGYARYAIDHPFKGRVTMKDKARRKVEYVDETGMLSNDKRQLMQVFAASIRERNKMLTKQERERLVDSLINDDLGMTADVPEKIGFVAAAQSLPDFIQDEILTEITKMMW